MTILLPLEIISEILIFIGDLNLCIQLKDNYSATIVYNKYNIQHTYSNLCVTGQLKVLK